MPPISFDGDDISAITMDGDDIQEVTMDGDVVWTAAPPLVDDFEDGDLSEYSFDRGGSVMSVGKNTSTAKSGDFYLRSDGSDLAQLGSTSGLDNYPDQGDKFAFNVYINNISNSNQEDLRVGWGSQNDTYGDQYSAEWAIDDGSFKLGRYGNNISNNEYTAETVSWGSYTGTWMECEVEWATDGTMTATLWETGARNNQISQLSATDTSNVDGGIGMEFLNIDAYMDYYRITGSA